MHEAPTNGLFFISSGRIPPNPSELLMQKTLSNLIKALDEFFDLVILDCPPILAVTDPLVIANVADTSILVVRHGLTIVSEIEASVKVFEASGKKISGTILNGFDPKKSDSGTAYHYRYDMRITAD